MLIAAIAASPFILFVLYLAYCALRLAQVNGKLEKTPLIVRAVCWMILMVMVTFDVAFNITIGSVMFWELPNREIVTFTARCKSHLAEHGRRGDLGRWICHGWLNPFDNHC